MEMRRIIFDMYLSEKDGRFDILVNGNETEELTQRQVIAIASQRVQQALDELQQG